MRISDWSSDVCSSDLADIGSGQGRRIVDAVAGHGNHPAFTLEPGDYGALLVRQDLGLDLIDPKPPSNRLGGRAVVARQHDDPDALCLRSEEHTSELQSLIRLSYAVFCLKKKHLYQ